MKVLVSGASGLIGAALIPELRKAGREVGHLGRREPQGPGEVRWDPSKGELNPADLVGVEAAVNLSGAGISSQPRAAKYKETLRARRVDSTTRLAGALAKLPPLPQVLISGSAIGYYGNTGDRTLDES